MKQGNGLLKNIIATLQLKQKQMTTKNEVNGNISK